MGRVHADGGKSTRDLIDARKLIELLPLKPGDTFLDAGCGDGFISLEAVKAVGDEGMVIAVDIYPPSVEALRSAAAGTKNIVTILDDITRRLPVPDGTVDIYFMANVFHGIVTNGEVDSLLAEVRRLLKEGGKVAIVDFKKIPGTPGPHPDLRLSEDEVIGILREKGFEVEDVMDVGSFHYLVLGSMI